MRLIRPILVVVTVSMLLWAVSCTLITDVDRTDIPEPPNNEGGASGD